MTQGRDFLSRVARVCWLGQQYPCLSRYVDRHAIIASSSTPTCGLNIHSARTTPHLAGKSSGSIDLSVVSAYPRAAGKPQVLRETAISHLNRTPCRRTVGLLRSLGSTTYPVALIEYREPALQGGLSVSVVFYGPMRLSAGVNLISDERGRSPCWQGFRTVLV